MDVLKRGEGVGVFGAPASSKSAAGGGGTGSEEKAVFAAASSVLRAGFVRSNADLRLTLDFSDLSLTLPPPVSKTILSGVTGVIVPGRVTAIMGPSGAGKTTFLGVLMGQTQRTSGVLRINGAEESLSTYRSVTGFVPQDDVMLPELTVRENILHSARVRLPRGAGWDTGAVAAHVDAVVEVLGLSGCADTPAGRVSGGQRKRTNIGLELAAAPAALFLDEPTSGLDSTAALEVCATLKAIADLGLTVVAVIHQPRAEAFATFDDLLLLAPGGRTVYGGPQSGAAGYFRGLGMGRLPGAGEDDDCAPVAAFGNIADSLLDFVAGRDPVSVSARDAAGILGPAYMAEARGSAAGVGEEEEEREEATLSLEEGGRRQAAGAAGARSVVLEGPAVALWLAAKWKAEQARIRGESDAAESAAAVAAMAAAAVAAGDAVVPGAVPGGATQSSSPSVRRSAFSPTAVAAAESTLAAAKEAAARAGELTTSIAGRVRRASVALRGGGGGAAGGAADGGGAGLVADTSAPPSSSPSSSPPSSISSPRSRDALQALLKGRGATLWRQFELCHERSVLQQYRQPTWLAAELLVCVMAGGIMGLAATAVEELYSGVLRPPYTVLSPSPMETMLPSLGLFINMAIGIAGSPAAVRLLGEERDVYLRERRTGHSPLAYFLAKNVAVMYRVLLAALHFSGTFALLAKPTCSFPVLFAMSLGIFWGVYGLGLVVSVLASRANAPLIGVVAALILACLCGYGPNINQMADWGVGFVHDLSYSRWANELWVESETLPYRNNFLVDEVTARAFGYTLGRPGHDIGMMLAIGLGLRVVAFVGMLGVRK